MRCSSKHEASALFYDRGLVLFLLTLVCLVVFVIFKSENTRRYIRQASAVFAQGAVPVILLPLFQTLRWLQDGWQAGERSVGFHLPGSLGEMPHHLYPPCYHYDHDQRHQDHDHQYLYNIGYSLSHHWPIKLNYSGPRSIW